MSWIVVLESDGRQTENLREGLAEDGWLVEAATTFEAAAAAVASRSPQLVLANVDVAGATELLRTASRAQGGPGSIALVSPGSAGATAAAIADEKLQRPYSDQDLRLVVRRLATAGRTTKSHPIAAEGERLTRQELFGDLLAEVEGQPGAAPVPRPTAPKPAPTPGAVDRQLSSLLHEEKPRAATPRKEDTAVDDLLSKTLSGLEVGDRTRKPTAPKPAVAPPKPAAPPAKTATPAATRPPQAAAPAQPAKPVPPAAAPATPAAPPLKEPASKPGVRPAAPSVDSLLDSVRPAPTEQTARKASKAIDLSSLDAYSKTGARDRTPSAAEPFATQKMAIPPAMRSSSAAPSEFGQYALLERIALGGMAEVWKARMKGVEGFQKTVAIKKILPHLTDSSDFVTMFIDEAKLAAQLNHTNIIHIYDLGKIGEDYYIAMEYVDGRDLRSIINTSREKRQALPLGLALLIASRLASALDYAHRKKDFEGRELGLVHRDVSPQNVLISFEGDIKLCDFGIVKAVSKASKTQMGALKGKLQYMSPEQAWGRQVDARSDIFSLGTLLFEMLTGQRLFTGESEMSVLDAVREGRIQAPRDLDPRVPLEVNALVLRALARESKDRYQSAGDLQREIDGILVSLKPQPTQRELAQYMQRLFGAEARPAGEAAKALPVAPAPVAAPTATPPPPMSTSAPIAAMAPTASRPDAALETTGGGKSTLWIAIAAAAAIGVAAILFLGRSKEAPAPATLETPAATAPEAGASAAPTAAPTAAPVEPAKSASAPAPEDGARAAAEVTKREEEQRKKLEAEQVKKAAAAATPAAAPAKSATPPAAPAPAPVVAAPAPAVETPSPAAAEPEPVRAPEPASAQPVAPAPKAPSVREGDLVSPGPGVRGPVLVSLSRPQYPPIARRMRVEGTVLLSLLVDENGRVADVRLDSGVSQNVGLNEAAIAAARTATYQPATKDGVRVKMWHQLKVPFKL
jgi:TonB family protein